MRARTAPPSQLVFNLWGRALALATLIHVALPDFQGDGWWLPGLMKASGAILLLGRASFLGFFLCAIGGVISLVFFRDVLTQSSYLLLASVVAMLGSFWGVPTIYATLRMVTAATYGLAAFHKLNTDFFDGELSCATHVVRQVIEHWPILQDVMWLAAPWPWLAIVVEASLALLIWTGSPWMWPLGILFHVPLTATLAPAFGAVMLSGYAAAMRPRDLVVSGMMWRHSWRRYSCLGALIGAGFALMHPGSFDLFLSLKLSSASALFVWSLELAWRPARPCTFKPTQWWGYGLLSLWLINGVTPYLGWQYQHTAAMLSNLRIDRDCANHMLLSAYPPPDPYVRIDTAKIGQGQRPKREKILKETLWNRAALATMHRNWCIPDLRPLVLHGEHQGQSFFIPDLCDPLWTESAPTLYTAWPGFQRFQKNLSRRCDMACIH